MANIYSNDFIVDRVHVGMKNSNSYQQNVPLAAKNGIAEVSRFLLDPLNGRYLNTFAEELVNQFLPEMVNDPDWIQPLKFIKRDLQSFSIEEIQVGLVKASGYNPEDNNLFKRSKVDVYSAFHTTNSRVRYDITLNEDELRAAFRSDNGLNDLLLRMLSSISKSAELDEFESMKETIAISDANRPLYNYNLTFANPNSPTKEEIDQLSILVRIAVSKMTIKPTGRYNQKGAPTVSRKEDLVILTTPEVMANMEVKNLANAFNKGMVEFQEQIIVLDEMPIAGTHLIIMDKNFLVVGDYLNSIRDFTNNKSLEYNVYLHKWTMYSASPFMNAVKISDAPDTAQGEVTVDLDSIAAKVTDYEGTTVTTVSAGERYKLVVTPTGTITPATPDFIVPGEYTVDFVSDDGAKLSKLTYVDDLGNLRIQKGLPVGATIVLNVKSAYVNPDGETEDLTSSVTLTVA